MSHWQRRAVPSKHIALVKTALLYIGRRSGASYGGSVPLPAPLLRKWGQKKCQARNQKLEAARGRQGYKGRAVLLQMYSKVGNARLAAGVTPAETPYIKTPAMGLKTHPMKPIWLISIEALPPRPTADAAAPKHASLEMPGSRASQHLVPPASLTKATVVVAAVVVVAVVAVMVVVVGIPLHTYWKVGSFRLVAGVTRGVTPYISILAAALKTQPVKPMPLTSMVVAPPRPTKCGAVSKQASFEGTSGTPWSQQLEPGLSMAKMPVVVVVVALVAVVVAATPLQTYSRLGKATLAWAAEETL
mmetsp:Transcript_58087/g.160615  ORF Transcript_58087/g.160615 Transcript_58087/m.160615 type:complete len:302 (-) Transcript_58087:369-1274(-)